ncbi:hypothetical protein DL765_006989 [Monosporascus sp. GIB2]|nr:hypothetical protein DL765_006989 [Monosporascus sp. GIB2]
MPLKPPAPRSVRDTLQTAYEDLRQTIRPDDAHGLADTGLREVRSGVIDIENQLAARQCLRNMRRLEPLFRGLEHYSKTVEILCNGTPYLSWIWSPITLILRVASEYIEAFEMIIKGYAAIAESLGRFERLNETFFCHPDVQHALSIFYADILQFHKHAYKFVRRNEDMRRHEDLIDKEANAANIQEARQTRQQIQAWRDESIAQIRRQDEERADSQYQSCISWFQANESDQLAIFDILLAEGEKYPGTCGWALKNHAISAWLRDEKNSPVLWVQGTAGSGKSVLAAQLENFQRKRGRFVIHHYCTPSYTSSMQHNQLLKSLLSQLLRRSEDLIAYIYADTEPEGTGFCWIVIDGLDACDGETQARFLRSMSRIISRSSSAYGPTYKALIASRPSPTISQALRRERIISLTEERERLHDAIKQYSSQRLWSLKPRFHEFQMGQSCVEAIALKIAKKADGMFLYARLVLDYVSSNIFFTVEEVTKSVDELPLLLSEFYSRILSQILNQLDSRSADRIKFLESPYTPLKLIQQEEVRKHGIAAILCLRSGLDMFKSESKDQETMIQVLRGFHAFQVYAVEYWTEYLLCPRVVDENMNEPSTLLQVAMALAKQLDNLNGSLADSSPCPDERLHLLTSFPAVQVHVQRSLMARSLRQLEYKLISDNGK